MRLKVAIIDHLGAHGSSHHFYLFGQAQGLLANNTDVYLYTNSNTVNPFINNLSFYQFYRNVFNRKNKVLSLFIYLLGSLKSHLHARYKACEIFHYHLFGSSILVLFNILIAKLLLAKVAITIHDVKSFSSVSSISIYSRLIYFFSDTVITHNKYSVDEITKKNNSIAYKISIIPHGNYLPFIEIKENQNESRIKLDIEKGKKVLLFFGMIKKVKGLDILLSSLTEVLKKHSDVVLLIAGKPWKDDFSNYQSLIDKLALSKYCKLDIKFISHSDVSNYYSAADLVVLPYRKIYQSGVLMMSLSYKKPVIVSDLPSFKEIIENNRTGYIFKSENSLDLSRVINQALDNPKLLEEIKQNGYDLIAKDYKWEMIGKKTVDAYLKINYFSKK